jgi:NDP-sugar pyrophosphorylase family protein
MAGGFGTRMTQSGMPLPKPLVPVLGVALLERNVCLLARAGVRRVVVAVAGAARATREFVRDRLIPVGAVLGITVEELVEPSALGNIGAAALVPRPDAALLVVYADNLTTLDLAMIHRAHVDGHADMTLAVHEEPFRMPFGEVRCAADDPDRVVDYIEKPTYRVPVCSAVSVLGAAALEAMPAGQPCGLSDLARRLLARSLRVRAWRHSAAWVDVNSLPDVARAERLVRDNATLMETWWSGATDPWLLAVDERGDVVLWDAMTGGPPACPPAAVFDVADPVRGRVLRVHVHQAPTHHARAAQAAPPPGVLQRWRARVACAPYQGG